MSQPDRFCSGCGAAIPDANHRFCAYCGAPLSDQERERLDREAEEAEEAATLGSANTAAAAAGLELAEDDADVWAALAWHQQHREREAARDGQPDLEAEERHLAQQLEFEERRLALERDLRNPEEPDKDELERQQTALEAEERPLALRREILEILRLRQRAQDPDEDEDEEPPAAGVRVPRP